MIWRIVCTMLLVTFVVPFSGCPLDGDNDGVPNSQDLCPNTAPGAIVNEDGCGIST